MKTVIKMMSIALMAVVFAACSGGNTPEAVVSKYLTYVQKGELVKALDLVKFEREMSDQDKQELAQLFDEKVKKEYEKKGGIASFKITGTEMAEDGNSAVVSYQMNYGNGTQQDDTQKVVKVDDKWLIDAGK